MNTSQPAQLPSSEEIHRAVEIYLRHAYGGEPPEHVSDLLPPEGAFSPKDWIFQEMAEREPETDNLSELKTVAFRLGNALYPNMKLRLSRPPQDPVFLFSVDSHDAMLLAPEGSPDHKMLEELKTHNAKVAEAIHAEWDHADLPTERTYLRKKIRQARDEQESASQE
jgi:hypothetical protein